MGRQKEFAAVDGRIKHVDQEKKNGPLFNGLYKKYFVDRRRYLERVTSEYLTSTTGKLCEYDTVLRAIRSLQTIRCSLGSY